MNLDLEKARRAFENRDAKGIVEYVGGCVGVILLLPAVLNILGLILGIFVRIPLIGEVFRILKTILLFVSAVTVWAALVIAVLEIIGLIYFMMTDTNVDRNGYLFAIITAACVILVCILNRTHSLVFLQLVVGLAAFVVGIDLFLKVWVDNIGLVGSMNIENDIGKIKAAIDDIKRQSDLDKSLNNEKKKEQKTYAAEQHMRVQTCPSDMETHSPYPTQGEQTDSFFSTEAAVIPQPQYHGQFIENNNSYFDGTGGQFLGLYLLTILVSVLTCSIATPWMVVEVLRWRISHTVICGKRQIFNGTGGQLIGHWLKWVLLSIITCGIYPFLQVPQTDYRKWVASHTTYVGCPVDGNNLFVDSFYTGTVGEFLGTAIVAGLITMITCGIGYPWAETMVQSYTMKNTVINTDRYVYTGTGGELFGIYLLNGILTAITCGIYYPWATCALNRYIVSHTLIFSTGNRRIA